MTLTDATALAIAQETLQEVRLGENFRLTPRGLNVDGLPSFERCEVLWETLLTMEKTIQFAIGDAMRYFRERWGERADQIISERTGYTFETLRNYQWMAEKVPQEVRRLDVLSPTHHQKVAKLPPVEQKRWLDKAAEGEERDGVPTPWTAQRLGKELKAQGGTEPRAWYVLVQCETEAKRNSLLRELEGRGYPCKATEKRAAAVAAS